MAGGRVSSEAAARCSLWGLGGRRFRPRSEARFASGRQLVYYLTGGCALWISVTADTFTINLGDLEMTVTVAIEIPREIIHATRMTPRELRQELAVHLFQLGKLSFGKARELAGMTVWSFQHLLGSRGIVVHYDVEDYEKDLAALRELGRL